MPTALPGGRRTAADTGTERKRVWRVRRCRIELNHCKRRHISAMNRTKSIGLTFARGLLAEKKGYAVNWAEYAAIQFLRYRKRDTQMYTFGPGHRHMRNKGREHEYRFDAGKECVVHDLVGAEDDWELNWTLSISDISPENTMYDIRSRLPSYPSQEIQHPLYRGRLLRNVEERLSLAPLPAEGIAERNNNVSIDRDAPPVVGCVTLQEQITVPRYGSRKRKTSHNDVSNLSSVRTWRKRGTRPRVLKGVTRHLWYSNALVKDPILHICPLQPYGIARHDNLFIPRRYRSTEYLASRTSSKIFSVPDVPDIMHREF
ncbi:hypothetical protein KC19_VG043100 [Ceratodon purpureus]|uniref:Uncharacterized protein n=1 Tax=Ceratodon purpureus TaxID=3225 RepID=A0A8T0HLX1_CERPU|nr:hypothetical protein KC19_VG043100 [Ceratodon purpureus]